MLDRMLADPAFDAPPFAKFARKIVLLAADDAFVLAYCRSTIAVLRELARDVVVVTRSTGCMDDVEALGVRVVAFDWPSLSRNLAQETLAAWRLARILDDEQAEVVHLFGFRTVALGAMAAKLIASRCRKRCVCPALSQSCVEVGGRACASACSLPARRERRRSDDAA
jgi:hypothetical protein